MEGGLAGREGWGSSYLFLREARGLEVRAEGLHCVGEAARLVAEGYEVWCEPVWGVVIGAFEGVAEEAEGGAQGCDVVVEVVEVEGHCGCLRICICMYVYVCRRMGESLCR